MIAQALDHVAARPEQGDRVDRLERHRRLRLLALAVQVEVLDPAGGVGEGPIWRFTQGQIGTSSGRRPAFAIPLRRGAVADSACSGEKKAGRTPSAISPASSLLRGPLAAM